MIRKALPYQNGTFFLVPLRTNGYSGGIVARHDGKGRVFGYFFDTTIEKIECAGIPESISPDKKILYGKFGDPGLRKGSWPILGQLNEFRESEWPMPPFVRVDEIENIALLSEYDQRTFKCISEQRCSPEMVNQYPYDQLMGYGAVEIRLTKLLSGSGKK